RPGHRSWSWAKVGQVGEVSMRPMGVAKLHSVLGSKAAYMHAFCTPQMFVAVQRLRQGFGVELACTRLCHTGCTQLNLVLLENAGVLSPWEFLASGDCHHIGIEL